MFGSTINKCVFIFTLLFLVSCGGGSSNSNTVPPAPTPQAPTPQPTTVTSSGKISGFGSVVVNGVHFNTDNVLVETDDDANTDENALAIGMVVDITGHIDQATNTMYADHISYNAKVEGPVSSIDLVNQSFVVLGQTVMVNSLTQFENITLNTLTVGNSVEVSGEIDANGAILASRVQLSGSSETEFKLRGAIAALDETAKTFTVHGVTVDYLNAQIDGTLANDVKVKVISTQDIANGILVATKVKVQTQEQHNQGTQRAIGGEITRFASATDFSIDDVNITTDAQTQFEHGQISNLALGVEISVHGLINENQVLAADKIRFDGQSDTETEGIVESVDATNNQVTLVGITFQADLNTIFVDKSAAHERFFDLSKVVIGDRLEIEAFTVSGSDMPIARKIVRKPADSRHGETVRGKVSAIDAPAFKVRDIVIKTTDATEFEASDNRILTSAEFFAMLKIDDDIKVKGNLNAAGDMLAATVEIKAPEQDNEDNNRVELQGEITSFTSADLFEVNHHVVITNANTQYRYGSSVDLALGKVVEVKGTLSADNQIIAVKVKFDGSGGGNGGDQREVEFDGAVNQFTSLTDFFVGDQSVTTNSVTEYKNGTSDLLANNIVVVIEGVLQDNGVVLASKVKFSEQDSEHMVEITGTISNFVSAENFMIDGQAITTSSTTEYVAGDAAKLADGVRVYVKGKYNDQQVLKAEVIEFK
jgi:hypothetical protein